jgi:two-component system heavy metal sensor histidine kinase CusS
LRPLNGVADTITAIDERSLDRRIDVGRLPPELRPMAERLNQMLARLEQGARRQETFMADAAHELRTPVTALMTSLEVALRRPRDASALREVLEECLADVRVLRRLIEALLDQFRSQAAGQTVASARVDVSALLDLCVSSAVSFGRHKGVDVTRS